MKIILIILSVGLLTFVFSCGQRKDIQLLNYSKIKLCDSIKTDYPEPTLIERKLTNRTLELSIRLTEICSDDDFYYGLLKFDNDTLKLYYIPKGFFPEKFKKGYIIQNGYVPYVQGGPVEGLYFCECYYQMNYKISGIKNFPKFIKINKDIVFDKID